MGAIGCLIFSLFSGHSPQEVRNNDDKEQQPEEENSNRKEIAGRTGEGRRW